MDPLGFVAPLRALALAPLPEAALPDSTMVLAWLAVLGALFLAGLFATLREALEQCSPLHVLEAAAKGKLLTEAQAARRARLEEILNHSARLTTTAGLLEVLFGLAFVGLLLRAAGLNHFDAPVAAVATTLPLVVAACAAVPFLLMVTRLLPPAFVRARGEVFLAVGLRSFHPLAYLLLPLVWPMDLVRKVAQRLLGLQEVGAATRILVEDLRDVIEDTGMETTLPESGLELIENVMDFHEVDVAAVMTPRTEIEAIEVDAGPDALLDLITQSSHSRIPLYDDTIDSVIGWISARDVVRAMREGDLTNDHLRQLARPAKFVPETKKIPDLLEEFRQERFKLAIVLDEYGGTAGLVTLGDVLTELVGEMHDEFDTNEADPAIRRIGPALFEVPGAEHVSDVNEALGLTLPEEDDYETLAGFILARLGRFPRTGDAFESDGVRYTIAEATDRRILVVHVRVAA